MSCAAITTLIGTRPLCISEVTHHEELSKLRRLHDTLIVTRQQVAGCTDVDATNYDPQASVRTLLLTLLTSAALQNYCSVDPTTSLKLCLE